MENALSRRNFIGGALIAGAGMVGAAALSGCAGKAYAKQDTTGIKWDKEADVVIVGGGAAGLWAAVQAYDNNLSAIVLEKQPEESAGGDVRCCGGYLFPISTDPNVLMSTGSFGEANEDLVYGIDEYGTDAIDWLVAHKYMEWADQPYVVIDGAGPGHLQGTAAGGDRRPRPRFSTRPRAYLSSPATRGRWLAWWPAPRTSPSM